MANFIKSTDVFGLFVYGFLERFLIPIGLHHLVYTPFQFTDLGGVLNLGEVVVAGAYPIVMTELQMGVPFSDSIYYMAIGFTKMFGYIGIGAAFIHTAHPHNKTFNGSADAKFVVEGLGGKDNINTVENCFTRLIFGYLSLNYAALCTWY